MKKAELSKHLKLLGACHGAQNWVRRGAYTTAEQAWLHCHKAEWLVWLLIVLDMRKELRKALREIAVTCAQHATHDLNPSTVLRDLPLTHDHAHNSFYTTYGSRLAHWENQCALNAYERVLDDLYDSWYQTLPDLTVLKVPADVNAQFCDDIRHVVGWYEVEKALRAAHGTLG